MIALDVTGPRRPARETPSHALARAIVAARDIRNDLLRRAGATRDLAGQCGLVSMLLAATLDAPRSLHVGFYMKLYGRRGRVPLNHAWCQVDGTIVDPTARQFNHSHRAVHVTIVGADDHYVETADGKDAIDIIMIDWHGNTLPEYQHLAKRLHRRRR